MWEVVVEQALASGADFGIKIATSGALKVSVEKEIIKFIPKGTPAKTLANVAHIAIEKKEAEIGAAVGMVFGPLGMAIGGVVGGTIGYIAGSKVAEKVINEIQKVRKKAREGVNSIRNRISEGIKSVGNSVKEFAFSTKFW